MAAHEEQRLVAYRCVVGHAIDASHLAEATEIVTLDGGAVVRVCREHGAPIARLEGPLSVDGGGAEAGTL